MGDRFPVRLSAIALVLACSGCYVNRAVIDPWSFAPTSPAQSWTPPTKALVTKPGRLEITYPPEQPLPFTLAELVDIALLNNPDTKTTWAEARTAAAQYGSTQQSAFPAINGAFNYERSRFPESNGSILGAGGLAVQTSGAPSSGGAPVVTPSNQLISSYLSQWGPQLTLFYTLFDFGKNRATSEAARQALYFADWTHNRKIQTVMNTVMDAYYNYLYQNEFLVSINADIETAQVTLDSAEMGLRTGVRDVSDVLQARTQLLQRQTQYSSQQKQVQNAFATLLNDMGLPSNLNMAVEDLPEEFPRDTVLKDADAFLEIALQMRPDLRAAEANLRSKEEDLRLARRNLLPTVGYYFNFGRTYFSGGVNDNYDFSSVVAVGIPLFQGFGLRNKIKVAEANVEQADTRLKQLKLQITKDVSTSHYSVKIAHEKLNLAEASLRAAKAQYEAILGKYRAGTTTIVDLISAQSSLAESRATLAEAYYDWYSSLSNLAYAAGKMNLTIEDKP